MKNPLTSRGTTLITLTALTSGLLVSCSSESEYAVKNVLSGDTVSVLNGEKTLQVGLENIVAPRVGIDCLGQEAMDRLTELLPQGSLVSLGEGVDDSAEVTKRAITKDGNDIAKTLVEEGFAIVNGTLATEEYAKAQQTALDSNRGIHAVEDSCLMPTKEGKNALEQSRKLEEQLSSMDVDDPDTSNSAREIAKSWALSNQTMLESVLDGDPTFQVLWGKRANEVVMGHLERNAAINARIEVAAAEYQRLKDEASAAAAEEAKRLKEIQRKKEEQDDTIDNISVVLDLLEFAVSFLGPVAGGLKLAAKILAQAKALQFVSTIPGLGNFVNNRNENS